MSGMTAGSRVMASWLGGGFAPGIAVEVNPAAQLVKVRFDDGREAWVSNMNVRLAPAAQGAPGAPGATGGFQPIGAPAGGGNFGAQSSFGAGGVNPINAGGGMVGGNPFAGLNPFSRQGAPPAPGARLAAARLGELVLRPGHGMVRPRALHHALAPDARPRAMARRRRSSRGRGYGAAALGRPGAARSMDPMDALPRGGRR